MQKSFTLVSEVGYSVRISHPKFLKVRTLEALSQGSDLSCPERSFLITGGVSVLILV